MVSKNILFTPLGVKNLLSGSIPGIHRHTLLLFKINLYQRDGERVYTDGHNYIHYSAMPPLMCMVCIFSDVICFYFGKVTY